MPYLDFGINVFLEYRNYETNSDFVKESKDQSLPYIHCETYCMQKDTEIFIGC